MEKYKNFIYDIPSFLFILLPIFLITGPFLSDLSISIISLIFLVYCFEKKNFDFFKSRFFIIFLILYFYILLNAVFNNFNQDSLKISFFFFRFGLFVGAIIFILNRNKTILKYFYYALLLCFLSLTFDGFFQYFTGSNIFGWKLIDQFRISSFFGDELILGSYLSRILPILFAMGIFFKKESPINFYIILALLVASEVVVFISGDRTAFVYINLSAIFVLLMVKDYKIVRLATFLIAILAIVLISFFNNKAKTRFIDQTVKQIVIKPSGSTNSSEPLIYAFSKQHTHHYISAYKMFLDNKLFGVGVKNFRNFCSKSKYKVSELSCSTHPHNTYIQVLTELGMIGFLFALSLLIYFFYICTTHLRNLFRKTPLFSDPEVCLLSAILISIWPIAPTGNVFNNWLLIIYFLPVGILFWMRQKERN